MYPSVSFFSSSSVIIALSLRTISLLEHSFCLGSSDSPKLYHLFLSKVTAVALTILFFIGLYTKYILGESIYPMNIPFQALYSTFVHFSFRICTYAVHP